MKKINSNLHLLLWITTGALILLGVAFYNGYPLVYSDTSTYLASGFDLEMPYDRPMNYGLFIYITSAGGFSLWLTAFAQSFMLSYLIFLTVRDFTQLPNYKAWSLLFVFILSAFSVLPFVAGQIITDIFQAISALCLFHLVFNKKTGKLNQSILYVLFFLATAMHMSHVIINSILLILIFVMRKPMIKKKVHVKISKIAIIFGVNLLCVFTMGAPISKSKHVFFMGRLAENGILKQYLKENCNEKNYKICQYIDEIPNNTTDFLWDENSPLYKYKSWKATKKDFNDIILNTFIQPRYLIKHIFESVKVTLRQLVTFDAGGGNGSFLGETLLYKRIKKFFPFEVSEYSMSRQNRNQLLQPQLKGVNFFYRLTMGISTLLLALVFIHKKYWQTIPASVRYMLIFLLITILVNAWVNASLVIVAQRFGAKIIWFIPLVLLLSAGNIFAGYTKK